MMVESDIEYDVKQNSTNQIVLTTIVATIGPRMIQTYLFSAVCVLQHLKAEVGHCSTPRKKSNHPLKFLRF